MARAGKMPELTYECGRDDCPGSTGTSHLKDACPSAGNPLVHEFPIQASGNRIRTFDVGNIRVSVEADREHDDRAKALASALVSHALGVEWRWTALENERDHAVKSAEIARDKMLDAQAKLPPPSPVRLLGVGTVRFDEQGRMWLMNKRETGWGSFAVPVADWDDLFRRYNVRVTEHGVDSAGAWWSVENCARAKEQR